MNQLSQRELDTKIRRFMAQKVEKFPDLKQHQPDRKKSDYLRVPRRGAFTQTITFPYLALHGAR